MEIPCMQLEICGHYSHRKSNNKLYHCSKISVHPDQYLYPRSLYLENSTRNSTRNSTCNTYVLCCAVDSVFNLCLVTSVQRTPAKSRESLDFGHLCHLLLIFRVGCYLAFTVDIHQVWCSLSGVSLASPSPLTLLQCSLPNNEWKRILHNS